MDPQSFREAWARFATGVTVITSAEPDGAVHGMTANGVMSVSLHPPLAVVSIGHNRNSHGFIKSSGRFGISILNAGQVDVAAHFTRSPELRSPNAGIPYRDLGYSVVIDGALAAMDCRVISEHREGDHTLFVAEVERIIINDGEPLLWYRSMFGDFTAPAG